MLPAYNPAVLFSSALAIYFALASVFVEPVIVLYFYLVLCKYFSAICQQKKKKNILR